MHLCQEFTVSKSASLLLRHTTRWHGRCNSCGLLSNSINVERFLRRTKTASYRMDLWLVSALATTRSTKFVHGN